MLQNIGDKLKGTGAEGSTAHAGSGTRSSGRWPWCSSCGARTRCSSSPPQLQATSPRSTARRSPRTEFNRMWQRQQPRLMQAFGGELPELQRELYQQRLVDAAVRGLAVSQYATTPAAMESPRPSSGGLPERGRLQGGRKVQPAGCARPPARRGRDRRRIPDGTAPRPADQHAAGFGRHLGFPHAGRSQAHPGAARRGARSALRVAAAAGFRGQCAGCRPRRSTPGTRRTPEQFAVAESVQLAYAELSLADVAAGVQVTDAQLRERYEQDKATYVSPETRRARHILISVDAPADDAKSQGPGR